MVDGEGALWLSAGSGKLLRRHDGEWTIFDESHGLPASFIYALAKGDDGRIWAGSHQAGLYVFDGGRFESVSGVGDSLDSAIRSIAVGRDGLVWVGTDSGGFSRLSSPRVSYLDPDKLRLPPRSRSTLHSPPPAEAR